MSENHIAKERANYALRRFIAGIGLTGLALYGANVLGFGDQSPKQSEAEKERIEAIKYTVDNLPKGQEDITIVAEPNDSVWHMVDLARQAIDSDEDIRPEVDRIMAEQPQAEDGLVPGEVIKINLDNIG